MDLSEDLVPDDQSNFNKVLRQVEFYLSEGNLNRDRFFKQEMQKRDDNGIPIALLLKCNRMIAMNVNEDILKNVVEKSKILRLSDDGLAIVRVLPLSDFGPREKRTILVTELPRLLSGMTENVNENDTSQRSAKLCSNQMMDISSAICELTDWIRNMFEEYGEVLYVSLPRYHRSNSFRGFAFVEFKTSKSARKAVKHMFSVVDNEHWLVKPTETSEVSDCPESAWKPRLAAKVSFSQQQMLARRYIWRCCSRKNKQLIVAFKHLRQAGYTAGNPCDKEYYSIILGDSSTEAILKYISWPSTLVFKGNTIDIPLADDICGTVIPPKKLSFARCLRISLEKNLLVPCNLLNDVAHVDPNPSQILLDSVNQFGGSLLPNTNVNESLSSNEFIPLFIRMKNNKAAVKLVQSIELFNSHGAAARILEGSSEQAYCNNIVNSKVNARERHRTSQIKKRQKQKSSNHHPVSLTNSLPSCKTDHKHIIFDE
ncbi:La-related protein 7 [Schistosoma japonicum]|nr:La-related protein 7 [Schistosoma japonicum]KAH8878271.1 La-related protein 7 [Schistosoma japonicum]